MGMENNGPVLIVQCDELTTPMHVGNLMCIFVGMDRGF